MPAHISISMTRISLFTYLLLDPSFCDRCFFMKYLTECICTGFKRCSQHSRQKFKPHCSRVCTGTKSFLFSYYYPSAPCLWPQASFWLHNAHAMNSKASTKSVGDCVPFSNEYVIIIIVNSSFVLRTIILKYWLVLN